jgi:hypothetical protein
MSKLNINRLTNENEDGAPKITGITSFSSSAFLETPKGTTAQRPENVSPGMIRFNTDSGHLEYYNGVEWTEVLVANNTLDGGNRGVFAGAYAPARSDTIEYITIPTLGNSIDFGNLVTPTGGVAGTNDSTRGFVSGGNEGSYENRMQYITLSSTGNAIDAGDLTDYTGAHPGSVSSSTRGIFAGGLNRTPARLNVIQYHTIQTTGNAIDFGDLSSIRAAIAGAMSSTRGVFYGGTETSPAPSHVNTIEYITMSTLGNSLDFGDFSTTPRGSMGGCSNSTRGIFAGGRSPADQNIIEFITIATTGNAQDFGDLAQSGLDGDVGAVASPTRAVIVGGSSNVIAYVTITSTGNSIDFGDLTQNNVASQEPACISNGHGGL